MRHTWIILPVIAALAVPLSLQAGTRDRAPRDAASRDAQPRDAQPRDAQPRDAQPRDADGARGHGWRWSETHADRPERSPRGGWLTVENPNHQPLEVLVDRRSVGIVAAGERAEFGPFEGGEHRVKTRFVSDRRELSTPVSRDVVVVRGRRGAAVQAAFMQQSLFEVKNTWMEPMTVRIDGQTAGVAQPGRSFTARVPTGSKIQALTPAGAVALSARASAAGLAVERALIVAPRTAYVNVHNPGPVSLRLTENSTSGATWTLRPGQTSRIQLASGRRTLQARYGGRGIDSVALLASPWRTSNWTIEVPSTAALTVHNDNPMAVRAFVNGELRGSIEPGERAVFDGVSLGRAEVTFEARRGRTHVQSTVVAHIAPIVGTSVTSQFALRDGRRARVSIRRRPEPRRSTRWGWTWGGGWSVASR